MFSEAGNMRRHIMYVHNAAEVVRHGCPHCDRDFTTKNNLITVSRTSKIHGFQISTYGLLQKVAISFCGGMSKIQEILWN